MFGVFYTDFRPSSQIIDELACQTRAWMKLFLRLGLEMAPYVRDFHIHLPMSVKLFEGQDRLSGELVEKKTGKTLR